MDADLFDLMSSMLERRHVLCRHLHAPLQKKNPPHLGELEMTERMTTDPMTPTISKHITKER